LKTPDSGPPDRKLWEGVWEKSTVARPIHEAILEGLEHVIDLRGAKVLEIGCGSGVDSAEIALRGGRSTGVDYSLHALSHAQRHILARKAAVALAAGDLFRLPFANSTFDLVFSQGLLEHFNDPVPAIIEQIRVIRPGGFLCIDVPQTYSLLTLHKRWHMRRGTWFAGWETNYSLPQLENIMRGVGLEVSWSYGWLYFPSLAYGFRNLHTLNERYKLPLWLNNETKQRIERGWCWLEKQRWYYRWMGCIGVIGRKL
jgi:SAM-dependent methyltransferase